MAPTANLRRGHGGPLMGRRDLTGPSPRCKPVLGMHACMHALTHSLTSRSLTAFLRQRIASSKQLIANSSKLRATRCRLLVASLFAVCCSFGCGPAPSDEAANLAASASQPLGTGPLLREASGLSPSGIPGAEPVPSGATQDASAEPREAEPFVVPEWMAKDLASPDVRVRLQALDRWAQHAPKGSVNPLIVALEDRRRASAREGVGLDRARLGAGADGGAIEARGNALHERRMTHGGQKRAVGCPSNTIARRFL